LTKTINLTVIDAFIFVVQGSSLDSSCCVDGGVSHHIGTKRFYETHRDWFTDVPLNTTSHLPTCVQGLFGRDAVWKVASFTPPWPEWSGLIVAPLLITEHGTAMLISERQLVADNQCTVTHSPSGKWITLRSGDTIDLHLRAGVHWMPGNGEQSNHSFTTTVADEVQDIRWLRPRGQ
jgi:hypothetical protein